MELCRLIAVSLLTVGCMGCGSDAYAQLGLIEVSGIVLLDGKPLPNAKVSFEGEDKRQAIGVADSAGRYRLMYDSRTAGVTPGRKTVRITTADVGLEGDGLAEGASLPKETIPSRYNVNSELKADVTDASRTFDFSLKSAP